MSRLLARFFFDSARSPLLFVGLAAAILGQALFQLGSPLAMKYIFDEGITQQDIRILYLALGAWAALLVLLTIGTFAQEYAITQLGVKETNRLRQSIFEKIQKLPPDYFSRNSPSEVANVFSADVATIETAFVRAFPAVLLYGLVILLSVIFLFIIEWRLALVTIASLTVVMGLPKAFSTPAGVKSDEYARLSGRVSQLVQESTATHVIVRLFALGQQREQKFSTELRELGDVGTSAHFFIGLVGRTASIGTGFSQLVVIGVGGVLAAYGYMTAGMLIAFIGLLLRIGDGVAQLSVSIPMLFSAATAKKQLDRFLAQEVATPESPHAVHVERLNGKIEFEDVVFGYDRSTPVLKNVSFRILPGEAVAFVGPSGSGKSTVMSLLLRIYGTNSGRITLDGVAIEDIAEESLRANMSVVPQNAILFETSIRDNILVGRPDATEQDVIDAARAANIHDQIMAKPDAYDTMVTTSGGALSGGERQRIATARAFLRGAPILLLDEATSALDPASELMVNRSISGLAGKHTVVAVTHRLASIVDFDRIFVLKDGVLIESGRHEELLARDGLYNDLWQKQHGMNLDIENGAPVITAERLALIPFFADCQIETLRDLSPLFILEHFREGSYVLRQGDSGERFYIVARGRLEIRRELGDGAPDQLIGALSDGDFFGELALVRNQPRAASIMAITDCWCLGLPRQHLLALMNKEPAIRENIAAAITKIERS